MHTHAPITEAGIKAQAQLLKTFLQSKNAPLNHMTCLDAVSVQYGYPSWQHARAALAQHQVTPLSPQASAEVQAKHVADLIVQFGAVHAPVLVNFAKDLLQSGLDPVYVGEYQRRDTPDRVERTSRLSASQPFGTEFDVRICAELLFDLRFDVDVVYLDPLVLLDVTAIGEIDWQCSGGGEECALSLSDPDFTKKLKSFVQSIPVQRWVQDELDARGMTLKDASTHFGQILFGR
jgi:hypothetical protein